MKPANPPALATKLLESLVPRRTSEALLGDLIEQYEARRSRTWYWQQVILALVISAGREVRTSKLQAVRAVVIGYLTGASLAYFTTSLAGRFVGAYMGVYTAYYLIFLPLSFFSAVASGWIVRRLHPRAMVLIWAGFGLVASVVAVAVYALRPIADRMPRSDPRVFSSCRLHRLAARRVGGRALGFVRCKRWLGIPRFRNDNLRNQALIPRARVGARVRASVGVVPVGRGARCLGDFVAGSRCLLESMNRRRLRKVPYRSRRRFQAHTEAEVHRPTP